MKTRLAVAALALAVLAGCSASTEPPPEPTGTTSTPTQAPTDPPVVVPDVVTVNPEKVIDDLPDDNAAYDTSGGSPTAPTSEPNGQPFTVPEADQKQRVLVAAQNLPGDALPDVKYAKQSTSPHIPRFTPQQAVATAITEAHHPSSINWAHKCEGFAGSYVWGWQSSGWQSAREAMLNLPAANRHELKNWTDPPAGALVYWSHPVYGHATLSLGDGKIASTDILQVGRVGLVPIKLVADKWFGGVKPVWFDPEVFPRASGNNGLKPPTPESPFPLRPGERKPQVTVVKQHLGVANSSPLYGQKLLTAVKTWQTAHGRKPNGLVGARQYAAIIAGTETRAHNGAYQQAPP